MNLSSTMPPCFYTFLLFFIIFISSAVSSPSVQSSPAVPYNDHCSSIIPESSSTIRSYTYPIPPLSTTYLTGGERLLDRKPSENQSYYYVAKNLRFPVAPIYYETNAKGIYKVEAYLYIRTPYRNFGNSRSNYTYGGSYSPRNTRLSSIRFSLSGFWSEFTRKLCMVGSASWQVEENKILNLDAVLKLKYYASDENPTIHQSVISGTLESIGSVTKEFDPIMIFSFPVISDYKYSLVTKEIDGGFVQRNLSHSIPPNRFCSVLTSRTTLFEMEYETECKTPRKCSPVGVRDGILPRFVSLYPIQCSEDKRKLRYIVTFQNLGYVALYRSFGLNSTLLAEGSWDNEYNRVLIVACRILNTSDDLIGDCSTRMSLRYPSVLTIRNRATIVGKIWTNRSLDDSKYFKQINLTGFDEDDGLTFPGSKFEYMELDRVKLSCPMKNLGKKKGIYPNGYSYDMRFDMSVKNLKGEQFAWGYATPLYVGDERSPMFGSMAPESSAVDIPEIENGASVSIPNAPLNISYSITVTAYNSTLFGNWFPTVNWSMNPRNQLEIVAEGVYDARTGHLCMLGCRKLSSFFRKSSDDSSDCQILVNFEFASLNDKSGGGTKGTIKSTREKTDRLYFEEFSFSSAAYYKIAAERSVWRMDFEIIMVLVSNTLLCFFIALQLFHVKRNPEVISGISLVMVVILSVGLMIPLLVNFEAVYLGNHEKREVWFGNGGWLEANEVAVRVVTMVAFLLQVRLLQLVWASKTNEKGPWAGEKKSAFISMPLYFLGALFTLLLNWTRNKYRHQDFNPYGVDYPNYSLFGNLRSYAGLILDGFLFPQILLNVFRGSAEKALSHPFYIGTSAIRMVPHAYDQYRAYNYPASYVNGTYYYANPSADFYSTAWDVVIPCGILALAVVVFLQQRRGGQCILPKRFRELELYEKVNVVENEA